jgi:hypothetical protein
MIMISPSTVVFGLVIEREVVPVAEIERCLIPQPGAIGMVRVGPYTSL